MENRKLLFSFPSFPASRFFVISSQTSPGLIWKRKWPCESGDNWMRWFAVQQFATDFSFRRVLSFLGILNSLNSLNPQFRVDCTCGLHKPTFARAIHTCICAVRIGRTNFSNVMFLVSLRAKRSLGKLNDHFENVIKHFITGIFLDSNYLQRSKTNRWCLSKKTSLFAAKL